MILNLYSIRDEQGTFGNPFAMPNDNQAIRDFAGAVNCARDTSPLAYAPSDFVLYHVGQFDLENGKVIPDECVVYLKRGSDLIAEK